MFSTTSKNTMWAIGGLAAGLVFAHYKKLNYVMYGAIGLAGGFVLSNYIINPTPAVASSMSGTATPTVASVASAPSSPNTSTVGGASATSTVGA